jgi:hypothetical protein
VREAVLGVKEVRRQTAGLRGGYGLRDDGCDIAVVGNFGAEIGRYRLRLAGFGSGYGDR